MAAHCESGTITNLVANSGLEISEPLVFGISSGIFFGYMKTPMREFPTTFSRIRPGKILDNFSKITGVRFVKKRYNDPEKTKNVITPANPFLMTEFFQREDGTFAPVRRLLQTSSFCLKFTVLF